MHVESCVVCIVGKMAPRCRDGVKVLCNSHLVWLGFEGFIPTCGCSVNVLCLLSVAFFVMLFRNDKREER